MTVLSLGVEMITLTASQVHALTVTDHIYFRDPADSLQECLICNAFVTDLIDAWQTHEDNISWLAVNSSK